MFSSLFLETNRALPCGGSTPKEWRSDGATWRASEPAEKKKPAQKKPAERMGDTCCCVVLMRRGQLAIDYSLFTRPVCVRSACALLALCLHCACALCFCALLGPVLRADCGGALRAWPLSPSGSLRQRLSRLVWPAGACGRLPVGASFGPPEVSGCSRVCGSRVPIGSELAECQQSEMLSTRSCSRQARRWPTLSRLAARRQPPRLARLASSDEEQQPGRVRANGLPRRRPEDRRSPAAEGRPLGRRPLGSGERPKSASCAPIASWKAAGQLGRACQEASLPEGARG